MNTPLNNGTANRNNEPQNDPPPVANPVVAKLKAPTARISLNTAIGPPPTANTGAAVNNGPRCSGVVKEVKKLEENREKRRARQAEVKVEKMALMNMDPGNP